VEEVVRDHAKWMELTSGLIYNTLPGGVMRMTTMMMMMMMILSFRGSSWMFTILVHGDRTPNYHIQNLSFFNHSTEILQ